MFLVTEKLRIGTHLFIAIDKTSIVNDVVSTFNHY